MKKLLRAPEYLDHILGAIERVQRYTAGLDEQRFMSDEMLQDAVVRNVEVIGEAANNIQRVDPSFAEKHSEIPWQVMYTMRNRLTHGYDVIDFQIVWKTTQEDFPLLGRLIRAIER